MNTKSNKKEPRIFDTLRRDIQHGDFLDHFRRELRELQAFYITDEQRDRVKRRMWLFRSFYYALWILKSMFFHLTPTRRILLVAGIIMVWSESRLVIEEVSFRFNFGALGGLAVFLVLLLELKDKLLAHDELAAGRTIQSALMPPRSPEFGGWSLWLYTMSANDVGGDLVDFLRIDDRRGCVVMADMAGKGLRAALLTAKLQATIRALAADHSDPAALCGKVNAIFHRDGLPNMFASLLYSELSNHTGDIRFVNAGHLPPLLLSADGVHELPKGELALGLSRNAVYHSRHHTLKAGEVFFAFSDGLTEARNEAGEFFGAERLLALLTEIRANPASTIGEITVSQVRRFTGEARANDDLSILVVKKT